MDLITTAIMIGGSFLFQHFADKDSQQEMERHNKVIEQQGKAQLVMADRAQKRNERIEDNAVAKGQLSDLSDAFVQYAMADKEKTSGYITAAQIGLGAATGLVGLAVRWLRG